MKNLEEPNMGKAMIKEVIVVVPIYKNNLDPYEKTSLDYCKQYLNKHHILIISPQSLSRDKEFLEYIKKEKLDVHYFENKFFKGIDGYNSLMLNLDFYKTFSDYQYMLIYQLDALVFSDDLLAWTKKGYDYIGAPWLSGEKNPTFDSAGNGGFSLRKIETFVAVLESKDLFYTDTKYYKTTYRACLRNMILVKILKILRDYNFSLNYLKLFLFLQKITEDYFWAFFAKFFIKNFKVATVEDSLKFCFEVNPTFCYKSNEKKLPFGAHAWQRYDLEFWLKHVDGLDDIFSKNTESITKPLVSIITVVFNGEEHLEATIQSVINQTYDNIEYIIIDGGSTDGTVEIIKKYEDKLAYWISEKDAGLYDAMNKGVKLITGDFVNFLNADDIIYANDAVENIVKQINDSDSVYFSRAHVVSDTVSWMYPIMEVKDINKWLKWNLPNHQTMFFPKSFYKKHSYDMRLSIGADDDYKLFALKNHNVEFIDLKYVEFKRGGVSSNHKSIDLFLQRIKESYLRNFKHKRWIRFVIDPFKLMLMFLINSLFGKENFSRFIKIIVKLKS